jgi:NADH dehydrogenase [ubiquinone] 1 alpha subcomplex assembly factor 7
MNAGQSRKIRLVELGPGRGTLMDDILRVCVHILHTNLKPMLTYRIKVVNQFPASRSALKSVHLIENSSAMQAIQKKKLLPISKQGFWDLSWHDSLDTVPQDTKEYTMLVAHEFFDALPIHVLQVSVTTFLPLSQLFDIIPTTFLEIPARMARSPDL